MDNQQQSLQKHRQRREAERERKRALRACDGCRRQKEKCDGGVPCRRCTRLHRQCEFLGPTARDADGGDGSARNRSGASNAELLQRIAHMEKIITHYAGNIPLDPESIKAMAEAVDNKNPDIAQVHRQAPVVGSPGSDYLGVDDENYTVQPLDNNTTHYSGEFSHWNFSMRIKQWIEQCVPDRHDAPGTLSFKEYYRAEELQSSTNTQTSLSALPPRYVAEFLVQAFYKHAETNYFYVERAWLAEQLDLIYQNPGAMSRREVGTLCMIWIIFAIGTQYAYLDSRTGRDDHGKGPDSSPFSEDTIGVMFYQQACKLVPDVITVASLESVQAILLIGIYTLPLDASGLSYIYLNLAVKLAIQNGMHRKWPAEGLDPYVRETRNRVWWTAYTTEKRVGIYHGRPLSIQSKDVDAEMPADRPDIMPSNPANVAHMLATLRLNQALGKIAHEISVLRTSQKHEINEGLQRVIDMKEELRKWWDSLPETAFRKEINLQNPISRADMHLKLEYCLLRMYAGRPFIFPREAIRGNASTSSSPADSNNQRPNTPHKSNPRSILVADCVEAALTIVETCHLLQTTIGLARASYTEFSSCRAALLVIITQCLQKKTDRLRDGLRTGMAMIKEMSAGGESARSEASLIEVFERAISRLDATADPSGRETDYSRFKKWELLWKNDVPAQEIRHESSPEASMPLPPNPNAFWRGAGSTTRPGMPAMHAASPFMGMDATFPSVPQVMDEFSTLFGYGFGPSPESMAGTANGGMWMGP
ncbi:hypothetical protein FSOLCH5_002959 [Fusarium solani]|uniref:Fungal-specific transcription factor domain-containing protein n=1 Tax=Fusarium solani TaxID=169388 RepID=A0A9P9RBG0_FUSSL|nr:fungal-specific transcription factor domain-containing protein [Fusarium solani]KAH7272664.1 fungal-specific transcription factor domain-containing protein [Fusarium solani]KAJ3469110.1 hypothetical protein MRS44_003175 [Fusarium solani]KAJ4230051.1 hypothetical protein NW759_003412 [Fusarium solani]